MPRCAMRNARERPPQTITRDGFPLTSVGGLLADARHELEYGRGFLLLRGLPIDRYTDEEAGLLYRGIGAPYWRGRVAERQRRPARSCL